MKIYSSCTLDWYTNFCVRFGEYAYEKNCNNFSFLSNSTQHIYLTSDEIRMLRYSYSWNIYQANEWKYGTFFFFFFKRYCTCREKEEEKKNDKSIRQNLSKNDSRKRIVSDRCILCVCICVHFLGHSFLFENETETFCSRSKDSSLFTNIISYIFLLYSPR